MDSQLYSTHKGWRFVEIFNIISPLFIDEESLSMSLAGDMGRLLLYMKRIYTRGSVSCAALALIDIHLKILQNLLA